MANYVLEFGGDPGWPNVPKQLPCLRDRGKIFLSGEKLGFIYDL